jgi:hypothetical protein
MSRSRSCSGLRERFSLDIGHFFPVTITRELASARLGRNTAIRTSDARSRFMNSWLQLTKLVARDNVGGVEILAPLRLLLNLDGDIAPGWTMQIPLALQYQLRRFYADVVSPKCRKVLDVCAQRYAIGRGGVLYVAARRGHFPSKGKMIRGRIIRGRAGYSFKCYGREWLTTTTTRY